MLANAPVSQLWPNGQLNHPGTQPGMTVGHFRRRFRERSILPRITNRNYDASNFKGKGSVLAIPDTPVVETRKTRIGENLKYDEVKTGAQFMVIDRERYWGVKIEDEDKVFASFDIEAPIVQEADKQMAEDVEEEFVADVLGKCHEANQGQGAGIKSGIYNLGTAASPLAIFKSERARGGQEGVLAGDLFEDMASVLGEQPGGLGEGAFILCPTAVGGVYRKGIVANPALNTIAADVMKRPIQFLGNVAGMEVISSNRLPVFPGSGDDPAVFPILFGDRRAITFAEIFRFRSKLETIEQWGSFHRCKMCYDWYIDRQEFYGVAWVTIGQPAVDDD